MCSFDRVTHRKTIFALLIRLFPKNRSLKASSVLLGLLRVCASINVASLELTDLGKCFILRQNWQRSVCVDTFSRWFHFSCGFHVVGLELVLDHSKLDRYLGRIAMTVKKDRRNSSPFLRAAASECPKDFLALASSAERRPMAFVRATGPAILETARDALAKDLAQPILVGEADQIAADAAAIGWDPNVVEIVHAEGEQGAIETAISLVQDGRAAGLVKGQLHTDIFMGQIVQRSSGIRLDRRLIHIFAMVPSGGGRPLLISDAAVNISPDIETRTEAALEMARLLRNMGVDHPRIAVLSATESELPAMPSSVEAARVVAAASAHDTAATYAGPLSFDLAISPDSAVTKGIDVTTPAGAVVGYADGLVVPDIVSGNLLFKSIVYFAGGIAAGLVVGGRVPIILTSRSDPPNSRLASLVLAEIYASIGGDGP